MHNDENTHNAIIVRHSTSESNMEIDDDNEDNTQQQYVIDDAKKDSFD